MMSKDITQVQLEKENPYVLRLKANLEPEQYLQHHQNATGDTLRNLTFNGDRASTGKSFIYRKGWRERVDVGGVEGGLGSVGEMGSNVDELNCKKSTMNQIQKFKEMAKGAADGRLIKGYPGIKYELLEAQSVIGFLGWNLDQDVGCKKMVEKKQGDLIGKNPRSIY
jgi:hypothetical protein